MLRFGNQAIRNLIPTVCKTYGCTTGGRIRAAGLCSAPSENANLSQKVRGKTPLGKLDQKAAPQSSSGADPYAPFPDHTNPETGEVGGPTGPEPTRYGDWERKGRVSDF